MTRDRVSIKGTSDGLTITIGSGDWQIILDQIADQLSRRASFFKGGRVALKVGGRLLDTKELEAVGSLLTEQHMSLWSVVGSAAETRAAAQSMGLEIQLAEAPQPAAPAVERAEAFAETTQTIRRTLRSGQEVEFAGNVIVIGDVNPGAKVSAGGYIVIWGRLRGTANAGAIHPEGAFVCALELAPMQLVIGTVIARSPTEENPAQAIPEMAFVQDGQIIAETWR